MQASPVAVRPPRDPEEVQTIVRKWVEDFRTSPWAGVIPNNTYPTVMTEAITQLLARGARLHVLCNADHPEQQLGWACHELTRNKERVLHYAFIKTLYRKRGLAGTLLRALGFTPEAVTMVTFKTTAARQKLKNFRFRPDIARRKDP